MNLLGSLVPGGAVRPHRVKCLQKALLETYIEVSAGNVIPVINLGDELDRLKTYYKCVDDVLVHLPSLYV